MSLYGVSHASIPWKRFVFSTATIAWFYPFMFVELFELRKSISVTFDLYLECSSCNRMKQGLVSRSVKSDIVLPMENILEVFPRRCNAEFGSVNSQKLHGIAVRAPRLRFSENCFGLVFDFDLAMEFLPSIPFSTKFKGYLLTESPSFK